VATSRKPSASKMLNDQRAREISINHGLAVCRSQMASRGNAKSRRGNRCASAARVGILVRHSLNVRAHAHKTHGEPWRVRWAGLIFRVIGGSGINANYQNHQALNMLIGAVGRA